MKKLAILLTFVLALGVTGCSNPASSDPKPTVAPVLANAEITDYAVQYDGLSYTSFAALIHNPNKTEPLFDIEVTAIGIGEGEVILAQQDFNIGSLAPDETWVLTQAFQAEKVLTVEFKISHSTNTAELSPRFSEDMYSGAKTKYHTSNTYGFPTGVADTDVVLDIPEDAPYSAVILCAAYFAKDKKFLGADCDGKDVIAGKKNGFNVYAFIKPKKPAEVKFYARYSG